MGKDYSRKFENSDTRPIKLLGDNQSAISIAYNPMQHEKTKHIKIDRHFLKEKLGNGQLKISYIPSNHQVADVLTKGLPNTQFKVLINKLGMIDIYSPAWGECWNKDKKLWPRSR